MKLKFANMLSALTNLIGSSKSSIFVCECLFHNLNKKDQTELLSILYQDKDFMNNLIKDLKVIRASASILEKKISGKWNLNT